MVICAAASAWLKRRSASISAASMAASNVFGRSPSGPVKAWISASGRAVPSTYRRRRAPIPCRAACERRLSLRLQWHLRHGRDVRVLFAGVRIPVRTKGYARGRLRFCGRALRTASRCRTIVSRGGTGMDVKASSPATWGLRAVRWRWILAFASPRAISAALIRDSMSLLC